MADPAEFFEREWPTLSCRIASSLARRGISASDRDDVLQETALRLFRSWDRIDQERGVEPYARVVANNVWHDSVRRNCHENPTEDIPEEASVPDGVEHISVVRDEFSRVRRALKCMRPEQSGVLYSLAAEELGAAAPASHGASDALRMARMRARRQLRMVLEAASAVVAAICAGGARVRRGLSSNPATLSALPAAAITMLAVLGIHAGGPDPSPPGAVETMQLVGTPSQGVPVTPTYEHAAARVPGHALASARRQRPKSSSAPYYWTKVGGAKVGTYAYVDAAGARVIVGENGSAVPVCTSGTPVPAAQCPTSAGKGSAGGAGVGVEAGDEAKH